jgi:hypothetical protein
MELKPQSNQIFIKPKIVNPANHINMVVKKKKSKSKTRRPETARVIGIK